MYHSEAVRCPGAESNHLEGSSTFLLFLQIKELSVIIKGQGQRLLKITFPVPLVMLLPPLLCLQPIPQSSAVPVESGGSFRADTWTIPSARGYDLCKWAPKKFKRRWYSAVWPYNSDSSPNLHSSCLHYMLVFLVNQIHISEGRKVSKCMNRNYCVTFSSVLCVSPWSYSSMNLIQNYSKWVHISLLWSTRWTIWIT